MPKRTPSRAPNPTLPVRHQTLSPAFQAPYGQPGQATGVKGQENSPSDGTLRIPGNNVFSRGSARADVEQMRPTRPSRPSTQDSLHSTSSGTSASSFQSLVRARSASICRERSCDLGGYKQDSPQSLNREDALAAQVDVGISLSEGDSSLESLRLAIGAGRQISLLRTGFSPDAAWTDSPDIASDPTQQPFSYNFSQRESSTMVRKALTQRPEKLKLPHSWAMATGSSSPSSARSRGSSQATSPFSLASVRASMASLPPAPPPPSGALPPLPSTPSRGPSKGRHTLSPGPNASTPLIRRTPSSDGRPTLLPPAVLVSPDRGTTAKPFFPSSTWTADPTPPAAAVSVALTASPASLSSLDSALDRHGEQTDANTIFSSIPFPAPATPRTEARSSSPEAPSTPSDGTLTVYSPSTPATSPWGSAGRTGSRWSNASRTGPWSNWEEGAAAKKRESVASKVNIDANGRPISTKQTTASVQLALLTQAQEVDPCASPTILSKKAGSASFRADRHCIKADTSGQIDGGPLHRVTPTLMPLVSDMCGNPSTSSRLSSSAGDTAPLNLTSRRQPLWGQGMPVEYSTPGGESSLEGLRIDVNTLLDSGLMAARGGSKDHTAVQSVAVSLHGSRRPLQVDATPTRQERCDEATSESTSSLDLAFPTPPPRLDSSPI
ncbi:hypothetical protein BCV69DRAFT_283966 [Microstroma glucosiphilum]|uniref:Uncharacterized protein n=1 Tax=Pseudomicrostroma glucosiphilum TaxID=1684307 RepID=A0A316U697_9BASI|nr:hypothetical protein BCV69DRAFT_283966 [Pseudomicrostroma glucosiphilum]PWN19863.1 hypothetical protein BCV69DRAFT_283966 [Pseudomicrostroma glucosiphilum]